MELKIKGSKVTLKNNLLTGDTYRIKEFIKRECGGQWDANRKGWIVDPAKMDRVINSGSCYVYPETEPAQPVARSYDDPNYSGICPRCHTYCDGDCTAH